MTKVIAIANQKGGVGKTTTTVNLGAGLVRKGYKVLLIDTDAQGNLTDALGWHQPDELPITIGNYMHSLIEHEQFDPFEGILHHAEGVDLVPANIALSALEVSLVNALSRETILKRYIEMVKDSYDFILIDCMPSLGMITINALVAADSVLIPVQAHYLPTKGMTQLIQTIHRVQHINANLRILGVLMTMTDKCTNFTKDISTQLRESYGEYLNVFQAEIPRAIRIAETSAYGQSIFEYDPKGKAVEAFEGLVGEIMNR